MSKETRQVVIHTCDNCGKEFPESPDGEGPDGFYGSGTYEQGSWGVAAVTDWFACKAACIRGAVVKALEREAGRN